MKRYLFNAAMMPSEGIYTLKKISKDEFLSTLREWGDDYESFVGYPNVANVIADEGIYVPLNRAKAELTEQSEILIIKLTYRIQNPEEKKENTHGKKIEDYEFYYMSFSPF